MLKMNKIIAAIAVVATFMTPTAKAEADLTITLTVSCKAPDGTIHKLNREVPNAYEQIASKCSTPNKNKTEIQSTEIRSKLDECQDCDSNVVKHKHNKRHFHKLTRFLD